MEALKAPQRTPGYLTVPKLRELIRWHGKEAKYPRSPRSALITSLLMIFNTPADRKTAEFMTAFVFLFCVIPFFVFFFCLSRPPVIQQRSIDIAPRTRSPSESVSDRLFSICFGTVVKSPLMDTPILRKIACSASLVKEPRTAYSGFCVMKPFHVKG